MIDSQNDEIALGLFSSRLTQYYHEGRRIPTSQLWGGGGERRAAVNPAGSGGAFSWPSRCQ